MKIVLLNIRPQVIRERRYDSPNYPDPSLASLFSFLKAHNIECDVIDSKLERLGLARLIERLKAINPDVIGFSSLTHEIETVASAAQAIKNNFPQAKILIGGTHANALPKETLAEFAVFDIAVFGEGEETLLELVNSSFKQLDKIAGIAYRKGPDIIVNQARPYLNIESLPIISWEKFPQARYYPVFTSRGCAYKCIFCARPLGSRVRHRRVEDIIEELRRIRKLHQPKVVYFWDENFCANRARIIEILAKIMADKALRGMKWFCQAHINNLDYELLKVMKEAGCIRMGLGIESGSDETLRMIGKGLSRKKIIQAIEWTRKVKIPVEGYFMLGLPFENWQSALETIDFAVELNAKFTTFGIVVPYPGTQIYQMALKGEGGYKLISRQWKDYNKIIGKAMELESLSRPKLEFLQIYGFLSVLIRNFRFFDLIRFIFQYSTDIVSCIKNFFSNLNTLWLP